MRFVAPGYDADSASVPPNKVLFDSNDLATLAVLDSGQYDWAAGTGQTSGLQQIKSWSYGFVPLCQFLCSVSGGPWLNYAVGTATDGVMPEFRVSTSGIYIKLIVDLIAKPAFSVRWVAYRMPAI